MSIFLTEDPELETAKQCAMEAARQTGDVWIVFKVSGHPIYEDHFMARSMSVFVQSGAPVGGKEVGRAGMDRFTGEPFWSTLQ